MTLMHPAASLLRDYLFLVPVLVLVLTEATKAIVEGCKTGNWHTKLFHPGGMPSTHSAFVTSLLIIVGYKETMNSAEFAIAFAFACIVWYDAFVTRRALEQQAQVLNRLQKLQHLRDELGHTFKEVLAGIFFGAVVTFLGLQIL